MIDGILSVTFQLRERVSEQADARVQLASVTAVKPPLIDRHINVIHRTATIL